MAHCIPLPEVEAAATATMAVSPTAGLIKTSIAMPDDAAVASHSSGTQEDSWLSKPETLVLVALALMLGIAVRRYNAGRQ